jgi:hypothetical protein
MAILSEKQYNTFVKGLVTEASPLTFPENSSLDEDNFVLERNGSRSRRLGLEYETGYQLKDTGLSSTVLASTKTSFHVWPSPNGDTSLSIGIVRVYNRFWFVNLLTNNPSGNFLNSGNYITISSLEDSVIDTAVINNTFVIVSKDISKPVVFSYNSITDTVTQSTIDIKIRDFWGVNDGLDITTRASTITSTHRYNLVNQGWSPSIESGRGGADYAGNAIDTTFTRIAVYPSNADIWYLSKEERPDQTEYQKYNPNNLIRRNTDNARAPMGALIIDAFNRGTSRETSAVVSGLNLDKENGNFTTVASYGSRIFYSGVSSNVTSPDSLSPNYNGFIFFSQIVTSTDKLGKCYQEADPTSEENSDLLATDGGTIHIPEITKVIKLYPSKGSLVVFAENGIWEIFSEGQGFSATSFSLSKISATGVINKDSIIESNGTFLCFTKAGIFSVSPDQVNGRYLAENISLNTIQTLYNNLTDITKQNAKAYYDEKENRVRWLYNDSVDYSEVNYVNYYNKELILDLTLGAFYPHSFSNLEIDSPRVADYIDFPGYSSISLDIPVYVENDPVIVTSTDEVIITENELAARISQFGFLTFVGTSFTISKYSSRSFKDWVVAGGGTGANYSSYLVTGYEIFGNSSRNKQANYVTFFFERTEDGFSQIGDSLELDNPSACLVQAQWDWANSANSGKWGDTFQAYRFKRSYIPVSDADTFDYGYRVIVSKNKLRGTGKALSLKIQSEAGKDIRLLGWTLNIEADNVA